MHDVFNEGEICEGIAEKGSRLQGPTKRLPPRSHGPQTGGLGCRFAVLLIMQPGYV
jgi:hypothetical protein